MTHLLLCIFTQKVKAFITKLTSAVGGDVKILFESELGVADFHLPNKSSILYVSECDVIAGNSYKRKLVRYRNV